MQLAPLRKEIKDLKLKVAKHSQNQFIWHHDEQGNLVLQFGKTETITLPLITLRPYQKDIQTKLFHEGYKRFFLVRPRRAGKEMESWNLLIQGALTQPGLYLMIYPTNVRARLVLWEGAVLLNEKEKVCAFSI